MNEAPPTSSSSSSLQERLAEELTHLPGRVSRYFFLVATLDAQATQMNQDLQTTRQQMLLHTAPTRSVATSTAKQLDAIQELHNAQRQLLADKLYVERKAAEWFNTARQVVLQYNTEARKRQRLSAESAAATGRYHSPRTAVGQSEGQSGSVISEVSGPSRTGSSMRRLGNSRGGGGGGDGSVAFSVLGSGGDPSAIAAPPKKRRITYEKRTGRPSQDDDAILPRRSSSSVVSDRADPPPALGIPPDSSRREGGVIIKLGSQKGRPRKSTKHGASRSVPVPSEEDVQLVPTPSSFVPVVEEYLCPICGRSENENPSMVACDNCDRWYHCVCVGFADEADAASKAFYCPRCRTGGSQDSEDDF